MVAVTDRCRRPRENLLKPSLALDQRQLGNARRLHAKLTPLAIRTMSLPAPPPRSNRFGTLNLACVHWVRPELVCEVTFLSWTDDGLLRQVTYQGLREDKPAREVRRPQVPAR